MEQLSKFPKSLSKTQTQKINKSSLHLLVTFLKTLTEEVAFFLKLNSFESLIFYSSFFSTSSLEKKIQQIVVSKCVTQDLEGDSVGGTREDTGEVPPVCGLRITTAISPASRHLVIYFFIASFLGLLRLYSILENPERRSIEQSYWWWGGRERAWFLPKTSLMSWYSLRTPVLDPDSRVEAVSVAVGTPHTVESLQSIWGLWVSSQGNPNTTCITGEEITKNSTNF